MRIAGTEHLLGALPQILGRIPAEEALLIAVAGGSPSALIYRLRLALPPAELAGQCGAAVADAVSSGANSAVVLVYADDAADSDSVAALTAATLVVLAERARLRVLDAVRVVDARWWSYECDDPSCCPPEGHHLPTPGDPTP